jgi:hypothetical protein
MTIALMSASTGDEAASSTWPKDETKASKRTLTRTPPAVSIGLAEKHLPTHLSLKELMGDRPLFEFTEAEAERFSKANIIKGMVFPKEAPVRSEPEYLEPGSIEQDEDKVDPDPPPDDHEE